MYNKAKKVTMVNTNDVFMTATLRLQADFKSKEIFSGKMRGIFVALSAASC
jgi:hypothetical protein